MGLDLAPGVILSGDDENDRYPSFSGQVALDLGGLVAPFYQLDVLRSPSRTYRDSFVGLKLESYAAPLGVLLMGLLAAATWE